MSQLASTSQRGPKPQRPNIKGKYIKRTFVIIYIKLKVNDPNHLKVTQIIKLTEPILKKNP